MRNTNTERNNSRVITVIQPSVSLTHVYLANLLPDKDGLITPEARYDLIVALLYRSNSSWEGGNPDVLYSSDYVKFFAMTPYHRPSDDGPCTCSRRGFQRCGEFGILPGTPDELRDYNRDLRIAIEQRIVHLIEVNALDAEKKNKQREYSRLYYQRKKAEKLAKKAAEKEKIVPEEEAGRETPPSIQASAYEVANIELHATCGQPLPRSLEELAHFRQSISGYPVALPYWCTCE